MGGEAVNAFRMLLDTSNAIIGAVNLGFYAWGSHDPANLAVGIFCFFAALWNGPRRME